MVFNLESECLLWLTISGTNNENHCNHRIAKMPNQRNSLYLQNSDFIYEQENIRKLSVKITKQTNPQEAEYVFCLVLKQKTGEFFSDISLRCVVRYLVQTQSQ